MVTALEDRELRAPLEQRLEGVDHARQVTLDQLALQRDGRRGDDDRMLAGRAVQDRRDEIGQALAGPGAGLDEQVLVRVDRGGDGLGHPLLPRA